MSSGTNGPEMTCCSYKQSPEYDKVLMILDQHKLI